MVLNIMDAIRDRLKRIRRPRRDETIVAELLAIGRRCASGLTAAPVDHGHMLYDGYGLPR